MFYWPLLWKEFTLRRKAWVQTPFEVILIAFTSYSLYTMHGLLTEAIDDYLSRTPPLLQASESSNKDARYIAYFPSTDFTDRLMNDGNNQVTINVYETDLKYTTIALNKSEDELSNLVTKYYKKLVFGVTFYEKSGTKYLTSQSKIEEGVRIKIRPTFYYGQRDSIHFFAAKYYLLYYSTGLEFLERKILEMLNNTRIRPRYFFLTSPDFSRQKGGMGAMPQMDTILLTLGTMLTLYVLVKRIITEKETKLRELMRLSGVTNTPYYVILFCVHFVIIFAYSLVSVCLYTNICNIVVLLIVYVLFATSAVLFAMAFTTIFNTKTVGNTAFVIVWLGVPVILMIYLPLPKNDYEKEVYCLLGCVFAPPTYAVGLFKQLCVDRIFQKRNMVSFDKLSQKLDSQELLTPLVVIVALVLSVVFWFLWLLYVGEIWPWQEGIPKPWHFPFSSFFNQEKPKQQKMPPGNKQYFEAAPSELKSVIRAENIRKQFGPREVLKGVNLEVYSGQITVLLGHNGAGKTTLMSIMTGLFPATSGRITVNGFDMETQTSDARKNIGLCTQTNVQFEQFTIEQHLYFFGLIKGCSLSDIGPEIDRVLKLLNIEDKRHDRPSSISGGMRRKLQLGIAFIGGSSILILDEPSSGLDVETRRVIWDMLLAVRKKYVILITTHHMEEADCLGDRIAIMSQGEVKCYGTQMFLKRAFGVGYFVRIAKAENFNKEQCEQVLQKHLSAVHLQNDSPSDIVYSFKKEETPKLPELFDELENSETKQNLGIASVGISVTSMDDVFLKVGAMFDKSDAMSATLPSLNSLMIKDSQRSNSALIALILKRFHNMKRQLFTLIFFFGLIALVSFIMCFYMNKAAAPISNEWEMDLNFGDLGLPSKRGICVNHTLFCEKAKIIGQNFKIDIASSDVAYDKFNESLSEQIVIGFYVKRLLGLDTTEVTQFIEILAPEKEPFIEDIGRTIIINTIYALQTKTDNALITASFNPQTTINDEPNIEIVLALLVFIPLMFLGLSVYPLIYPSAEKESNAKLLQMMTGIHAATYWTANLIFDLLLILFYSIPFFFTVIFFYFAMECITVFVDFYSFVLFVVVMLIFFITTTTMAHLLSFIFSGLAILFMVLIGAFVAVILLKLLPVKPIQDTSTFVSTYFFPKFPLLAMYQLVRNVSLYSHNKYYCDEVTSLWPTFCENSNTGLNSVYNNCCQAEDTEYLGWNFLSEIAVQVLLAIAFFIAAIVVEIIIDWLKRRKAEDKIFKTPEKEDSDVTALRNKAQTVFQNNDHGDYALTALNVSKRYGPKLVVDHLSFVVEPKRCFGLLGVNGAGKTTTFKMLIGDVSMTYGESFVNGVSVFEPGYEYRKQIGYCPQFDAFVANLTGREMLFLFARLRGYRGAQLTDAVEKMIQFVDLQDHANYMADTYSGGNKRKLSIGMAIIGFPSLLFLDEPTAGVDPVARRKVWKIIETCRDSVGTSIVLTSHSMDECENLCSSIGIMVKGGFRCMGSTQHLKTKFGKGYTITLKLDGKLENGNAVKAEMTKLLPKAQLKDSHTTLIVYHFEDTTVSLGNVFRALEKIKQQYKLEDYQLTDADLEQIFLGFAKDA